MSSSRGARGLYALGRAVSAAAHEAVDWKGVEGVEAMSRYMAAPT